MKKLLLLSNLCFCICFAFCHNNPKKPIIEASPLNTNKSSMNSQTVVVTTSVNEKGIEKDSTAEKKRVKAIIHNSSNQAKEDSIKKVKTKNKNNHIMK